MNVSELAEMAGWLVGWLTSWLLVTLVVVVHGSWCIGVRSVCAITSAGTN